jgi:SAM-dependent methyltransferase
MDDSTVIPNDGYTDRLGRVVCASADPWLERWRRLLVSPRGASLLELGCGAGRDTLYLTSLGLKVIAGDYSQEALDLCRRAAPLADIRRIDLREPLPFPDGNFPAVLASLCLHFFPWSMTVAMMAEIRRCLSPGGILLLRVNSSRDIHRCEPAPPEIEPGLFLMKGQLKRFFDRDALLRLLGAGWQIHECEELQVDRYGAAKYLWEVVLEKPCEIDALTCRQY